MATTIKPRSVRFDQQHLVRFSRDEGRRLTALAAARGVSFSRLLVTTALTGEPPSPELLVLRAESLFELRLAHRELAEVRTTVARDVGPVTERYAELTRALDAVARATRALEGAW